MKVHLGFFVLWFGAALKHAPSGAAGMLSEDCVLQLVGLNKTLSRAKLVCVRTLRNDVGKWSFVVGGRAATSPS